MQAKVTRLDYCPYLLVSQLSYTWMNVADHIVGADFLREYTPDVIIVMNPIYRNDIRQELARRGLTPALLTV